MIISKFDGIRIAGIAAAVSNNWTPLSEVSDEDISVIKKFTRKTGVEGRYNAGLRQTTSDFCYAAAKGIFEKFGINPRDIGILVFVTQTADYDIPATACLLQDRLGLSQDCIAFDVNLGCSGFTYGMNIICSLMNSANVQKALLLVGDTSAKEMNPTDTSKTSHSASMLFGDSGTATLLVKDETAKPMSMISRTNGKGFKAIISPFGYWRNPIPPAGMTYGVTMDDIEVFNFATTEAPIMLKETMDLSSASVDDYDCLVLHQANLFILKRIAKLCGFPQEKNLVSLDKFGNTSCSSVPITLVKTYGEKEGKGEIRALMCGFGIGLSWSSVDCFIELDTILPLIHTDEYFSDGYQPE